MENKIGDWVYEEREQCDVYIRRHVYCVNMMEARLIEFNRICNRGYYNIFKTIFKNI